MDNDIQKLIRTRLEEIPNSIRTVLQRPEFENAIQIIAEKHNLPEGKMKILENETVLVLLAFEPIEDFEETILRELLIPGSVAASVANDIDRMIFSSVKDELQSIQKEQAAVESEDVPQEQNQSYARKEEESPEQSGTMQTPPEKMSDSLNQQTSRQGEAAQKSPTPDYSRPYTGPADEENQPSDPYREPIE